MIPVLLFSVQSGNQLKDIGTLNAGMFKVYHIHMLTFIVARRIFPSLLPLVKLNIVKYVAMGHFRVGDVTR